MFPKVANHLLLNTSRVASAVQNATFRNFLQNQSTTNVTGWSNVGTSGSGGYGAGPGGAKYHAGSRFSGYNGPGRTLTQANSTSANDASNGDIDDDERGSRSKPSLPIHPRSRPLRRHSLATLSNFTVRREVNEHSSVLQTVQSQARLLHSFASHPQTPEDDIPKDMNLTLRPRRNSTIASLSTEPIEHVEESLFTSSIGYDSSSVPSASTQDVLPQSFIMELKTAASRGESGKLLSLVQEINDTNVILTVTVFNTVLESLRKTRAPGDTLLPFLDFYNGQIQKSIQPDSITYDIVIAALLERDIEIHSLIANSYSKRSHMVSATQALQTEQTHFIARLQEETNFEAALTLFQAASVVKMPLAVATYEDLLHSCSLNGNSEAAVNILAHLEERDDLNVTATTFLHMLSLYTNAGDLPMAKHTFSQFQQAAKLHRLPWNDKTQFDSFARPQRMVHMKIYNKMIECYFRANEPDSAIELLAQMMDSQASVDFGPADLPLPSSSTYETIIAGFCRTGDMASAQSWFDKLLEQKHVTTHTHECSKTPMRPSPASWTEIIDALAAKQMITELNMYFKRLLTHSQENRISVSVEDRLLVFHANVESLKSQISQSNSLSMNSINLLRLIADPREVCKTYNVTRYVVEAFATIYVSTGRALQGLEVIAAYMEHHFDHIRHNTLGANRWRELKEAKESFSETLLKLNSAICEEADVSKRDANFENVKTLWKINESVGLPIDKSLLGLILSTLPSCGALALQQVTLRDWEVLLTAVLTHHTHQEPVLTQTLMLMQDSNANLGMVHTHILNLVAEQLRDDLHTSLSTFGESYVRVLQTALSSQLGSDTVTTPTASEDNANSSLDVSMDPQLTAQLEAAITDSRGPSSHALQECTDLVKIRFATGTVPSVTSLAKLINHIGRAGSLEWVNELYAIAQHSLAVTPDDEARTMWQSLENAMIIANAQGGDMERAFAHRALMTDAGYVPSAEAYGSLIECVRDTTDDTSNAMAIFNEARTLGCVPSTYFFNNIISKLAKARKADDALEIFQQMKLSPRTQPTAVTYGAVIAACARVGDSASAERLFAEMERTSRKPLRIPPYNTMIQFYTNTKPNRTRALHYFNKLRERKINPTAHTYKLLIDIYGAIEPVDVASMQSVFDELTTTMPPQGTHWAALINSFGCVQKNLDKALAVFESIREHPSTVAQGSRLPDAIVYESLFLAIVSHKRMDLASQYLAKMVAEDVHMTAYIANLLIKGHAMTNNMDASRAVFESLRDPPQGVAAPNNHALKSDYSQFKAKVSASEPSYREPSTWEAMIRAEYGSGNHEKVEDLIARMKLRQFPAGVVNRITGIINGGEMNELRPHSADMTRPTF